MPLTSSVPPNSSPSFSPPPTLSCCPCTVAIDDKGSVSVQCHLPVSNEKKEVPPLRPLCVCSPRTKQRLCGNPTDGTCTQRWYSVVKAACFSWYFWACIVYVVYASQMLAIDFCPYPSDSVLCSFVGDSTINQQYVAGSAVHVTNAVQYMVSWNRDFGYPFTNLVIIPEVLNIIEASLYLSTSQNYANLSTECERLTNEALLNCTSTDDDTTACTLNVCNDLYRSLHRTELAASVIQMIASIGWIWSWWQTYLRLPGRGWTLDDPDLIGSLFTFIPSIIYVVYYVQIYLDPSQYGTNYLYVQGDILYMVGALGYLLGAWRDAGGSTCLPLAGGYEYEFVEYSKKMDTNHPSSSLVSSSSIDSHSAHHPSHQQLPYPNMNNGTNNFSSFPTDSHATNGVSKHSAIRDIVISPTPPRMVSVNNNFHTNSTTLNNPVFLPNANIHSTIPMNLNTNGSASNSSTPYRNRLQPPDSMNMH